jgi:uncharacterized paraquat-inducible protein A
MSPEPSEPARLQSRGVTVLLWLMLAVALVLLYIGWTHPLLTVRVTGELPALLPVLSSSQFTVLDETRSVLTMVMRLMETDYMLIAVLIIVFGVILPIVKNIGIALVLSSSAAGKGRRAAEVLQFMGRFAMVDIFAVAVIVSIVGASTIGEGANDSPVTVKTVTELRSGFYYFIVYVFLSFAMDVILAVRTRGVAKADASTP